MNWSFTQAHLLWGLPLLGIPLILHLWHRKRGVPHPFAAMEFLRRSMKKSKRGVQIKSLLLLLLRTLALAALIFALAGLQRSAKTPNAAVSASSAAPRALILLLDTSASLRWRDENRQPLFETLRIQARRWIQTLGSHDELTIVAFDADARRVPLKAFDSLSPSYDGTSIAAGVEEALRALKESKLSRREIHLFTDAAASAWELSMLPLAALKQAQVNLVVHRISGAGAAGNALVSDLSVRQDPADLGTFVFSGMVENAGETALNNLAVVLYIDGKEVARTVQSLAMGEQKTVVFHYGAADVSARQGPRLVRLEALDDAFPDDNARMTYIDPKAGLRVLVIDGNPQPNPLLNETFYLMKALTPGAGRGAGFLAQSITADQLNAAMLVSQDLVILANVKTFSTRQVSEIRRYVNQGGNLWIGLGDQIDADHYNSLWGDLLPALLRDRRHEDRGTTLQSVSGAHPILGGFSETERALFSLARFSTYEVLQGLRGAKARVLLSFSTGSPALVVAPYGRGRVALWTSSFSRAWSDFPIQTTFLAFVHQTSLFLGGAMQAPSTLQGVVGRPVTIPIDANTKHITVRDENGGVWDVPATEQGAVFRQAQHPGLYRIEYPNDGEARRNDLLWVGLDRSESKLARVPAAEWKAILEKIPGAVVPSDGSGDADRFDIGRLDLAPWLLVGVCLVLMAEALVTGLRI